MRNLFNWAAARLVAAFALALPLAVIAEVQKTNPVTGETETYENIFVGTSGEWDSADNWTLKETGKVPFVTEGNYDPALVTGKTVTAETPIDGWTLRVGAYNNARIVWSGDPTSCGITKIQGSTTGCWLTADETSVIIIDSFAGNQLEGSDSTPFKLSSAKDGGITWGAGLTNTSSAANQQIPFWYYLKGDGTVAYHGDITVANAQVIKMADITLSGTSRVASKTLVTFGSGTTKTFTADASIKVKNGNGDILRTVPLASVTVAEGTTLTTDNHVGSCELVQTSTGIVLYYVDGDPENLPVYKPSININFTNGSGLTTRNDVGLGGYAVPGTSWNNFTIPNNANEQTFSTLNAIDSTGAASVASGVSVTVSGHRGSYNCSNLDAASNPLYGYIDEGAQKATPTVTITGIPYEHYRVIVYHSTDTSNLPFGYDTINGFNFTYVNGDQTIGTDSWGNSGEDQSANPIEEGVNTLVSAVLSGDTVTMVAHRIGGGTPTARGCFAAIQVVEYVPEVGENDLEIAVNGATDYPVDAAKNLSGTVYLTGSGTLTLSGSEKITAATIDVGSDVILNINADRLDATTFTGAGTVVYDGAAPVAGKGWTAIGWSGTVWIKNQSISSFEGNQYGNSSSTIRFTGVTGFLQSNTYNNKGYVHTVPLELVDDGDTVALTYNNGWGGNLIKINTLKGSGTLKTEGSGLGEHIYIVDGSGFTGVFNLTGKYVYVGGSQPDYSATTNPNGKLDIRAGTTLTVPSGKTWTANGGFVVDGTIIVDGTLASSHSSKAVSGSGTVVFGGVPSPTGDAWWKNGAWTGTVQVNGYSSMAGTIPFNNCGNAESIVELKNVTGWINYNYTCTPKLKVTGTLYLNNGSSGKGYAFKVGTLLGDGTISGDGSADKVVFNVTTDWSGFTGTIGLNNKCVVFGSTIPDSLTAGTIYVSSGAVVTPQQSSGVWWAVGGIKVDGELRAPNLGKFGGGTTITTSDDGVFTLTDSNNTYDSDVNYARITGTGTLRYAEVSGKWRTLSKVNFPTNMVCENNLATGLILETPGYLYTIGSLSGSGSMRSDMSNGNRDLRILQAKDTTYSGVFHATDRIGTVTVAPGTSTAGTLTLSGEQTVSNDLAIETGAKVNLTGTWKGATTVAGTIGGTGTLTGDLTFSDGATFKAAATALTVSGTVALPTGEGESLTIDATGLDVDEATILSSSSITTETDVSKVTVNGLYTVEPAAGALKLVSTKVEVTVPEIANTTVAVAVGGETIGTASGTYKVAPDSVVTVTYAAAEGYEISGQTVYTINVANSETTFDPAGTTEVKQYVAYVVFQQEQEYDSSYYDVTNYYTTVAAAIDAAKAMKKTVVLIAQPEATDTYNISAGETINVKKGEFTFDGIIFPEGAQYNNTTTETAGVTQYKCTVITATVQYPGQEPVGMTGQLIQILGGLYSGYVPGYAGTVVTVLDGSDATVGNAMPEVFTYDSEAHSYTLKTMVASYNNGYTTTYYPTVSNAVATVASGSTITLVENVALDESVEVAAGKNVTIDLNGKTITGPAGGYVFANAGEVTITGNGTVTGAGGIAENTASDASVSIASGSYTATGDLFANVEGATIAVSGGTFSAAVPAEYCADGYEPKDNGDGTYTVRVDLGWIYEAADHPGYTGSWSNDVEYAEGKIKIEDGNTYTANRPSAGQLVTVTMKLSFDDANDEDEDVGDAKAAVRLASGETSGTYQFQLYTSDGANKVWTNATVEAITATKEHDYTFVFVLDLTNKVYTATVVDGVVTNAMTVGGATNILFAYQGDVSPVQKIEFIGSGSVTSIEGRYEDAEEPAVFVEDEPITLADGNVQLSADQAAWLNKLGAKSAVAEALATLSSDQFSSAYLLNLDLTDTFTYEFTVSDITVGDSTVEVEVTLTRTGTLVDGKSSINGTLKLMGGATLPASGFVDLHVAPVDDDDFSDGDTATWSFDKGSEKFFQPVIE